MRADSEEQLDPHPSRKRFPVVELVLALAVAAGLGALWLYWEEGEKPVPPPAETAPAEAARATPQPVLPPTPDIPRRDNPAPATAPPAGTAQGETGQPQEPLRPAAPEPLTLEEGNTLVREELALAGPGTGLKTLAGNDNPLDATAALIDGLGRGLILRKIVPASPPQPGFKVQQSGEVIYMDPASYARYDGLAERVSSLDTARLVDTFHTLRPLYEGAYKKLGLDSGDFDNAIIRTLDLVLATPEITGPIALETKSVVYVYADPALESLPPLQKQLLRMGPENIRRIKQQAQALRDQLLAR